MLLLDDDDDFREQNNWKNSEIMRSFVQLYDQRINRKAQAEQEVVAPVVQPEPLMNNNHNNLLEERLFLSGSIRSTMQKMAELSSKYGNEKVKYVLEKATAELEELVAEGDNNVF